LALKISRGNCQANLQLDRQTQGARLQINQQALDTILEAVEGLAGRPGFGPASPDGVLALKGVLETVDPEPDDAARAALEAALVESFATAAEALRSARNEEGAKIQTVLAGQVDQIETLAQQAATLAEAQPDAIRARLQTAVRELIDAGANLSEDRLAQEAALLATKQDVCEELDRLKAHISQARSLIAQNEPAGRRLDFLTQEFNREVNTLCSKAASIELTQIGLDLKAVIDQLREQVQNIE